MQPYSNPTRRNMEDDLNILKMEDDLNLFENEDDIKKMMQPEQLKVKTIIF